MMQCKVPGVAVQLNVKDIGYNDMSPKIAMTLYVRIHFL